MIDEERKLFHPANLTLCPQQSDVSGSFGKTELRGFEEMVNSWGGFPKNETYARYGLKANMVAEISHDLTQSDECAEHVRMIGEPQDAPLLAEGPD